MVGPNGATLGPRVVPAFCSVVAKVSSMGLTREQQAALIQHADPIREIVMHLPHPVEVSSGREDSAG